MCGSGSGGEAAVHALREAFMDEKTEAILLVDADNAFNSQNRKVALHNIQFTCPSLATTLINIYRAPSELHIDGEVILSQEGTTQGDPLAMPFYALSTLSLISKLQSANNIWFADDSSAHGAVHDVHRWWEDLNKHGPGFGYFVNPNKSWLIVKESYKQLAESLFANSNVNITTDGRPYLGSPLGTD
jgi:hypothetical protein